MRIAVVAVLAVLAAVPAAGAADVDTATSRKQVVRAWSARLNAYDNAGVARLFTRPATFIQSGAVYRLETAADIALWHRVLPCAGRDRLDHREGRVRDRGLRPRERQEPAVRRAGPEGRGRVPDQERQDRRLGPDPGAATEGPGGLGE